MHEAQPLAYFDEFHLTESVVLKLVYSYEKRRLELVVNYAAQTVSDWFEAHGRGVTLEEFREGRPYHMDLRRLVFLDVLGVSCQGEPVETQAEWDELTNFSTEMCHHITGIEVSEEPEGFMVEMDHYQLEGICFGFRRLLCDRRLVKAKPGSKPYAEGCEYYDIETGEPVDPHDPFPGGA
jgi:hypothetical protein